GWGMRYAAKKLTNTHRTPITSKTNTKLAREGRDARDTA
ncbi:hypothetical protein CCACVL1_03260, partial [Corchorus capsularis]